MSDKCCLIENQKKWSKIFYAAKFGELGGYSYDSNAEISNFVHPIKGITMIKRSMLLGTLAFLTLITESGCGSSKKIEIPQPNETASVPMPYEIPNSAINIGLSLTWKELAKQVNTLMPAQIMDDKDFNKDGLKLNIKKTGDINISFLVNQIQTAIPMSARVLYRYGVFGAYDTKEVRMQGTVYLLSYITIDEMAIRTKTKIDRIEWEQNPSLIFYGSNVPIGFIIDPILKNQSSNIASGIDDALKSVLDFKPIIKDQLQFFRDPILLSKELSMWLQVTPSTLATSPLKMNKQLVELDITMNTKLKTTLGKQPAQSSKFSNLSFKTETPALKETQIKLPIETDYTELSNLFTSKMKGQAIYENKNKKVFLDSIKLWHSDQKLLIGVKTTGAVSGWIYLKGVPKYNSSNSELYLDELDYDVSTKNFLVKSVNWLLSGKILGLFKENSKYSLRTDLDNLKKELSKQLNGYKPIDSVVIKFKLNALDFEQIHLTNSAIVSIFDIRAMIKTEVG